LFLLTTLALSSLDAQAPATPPAPDGRELFLREWLPKDPRSHGGDGLGPVFNDTSCVACHNQGGTGGGGPAAKNVQFISAFATTDSKNKLSGEERRKAAREQRDRLAQLHPGFRSANSVVLHRFALDDVYPGWVNRFDDCLGMDVLSRGSDELSNLRPFSTEVRERIDRLRSEARPELFVQIRSCWGREPEFSILRSQRNPIALFGSGKIDALPDEVILAAAAAKHPSFSGVSGRVARTKDGRIGRFGWKAQKAALEEFVRTACATELGLHVPGEQQAGMPHKPEYRAPGLDLDTDEITALTRFVAGLPPPKQRVPSSSLEAEMLAAGKAAFERSGCAACHLPALGPVDGIYSDLLLHDMGSELGDSGKYGSFAPDVAEDGGLDEAVPQLPDTKVDRIGIRTSTAEERPDPPSAGATRQEWRTPPLWGLRDSAPYLHDGSAPTIEHAIALHGGEAARSTRSFFLLSAEERFQMLTFLRSLEAPETRS
jgi:CxxC motif-containing protein (DUF1111 family)